MRTVTTFRDGSVSWSQLSDRGFTSGVLYFGAAGTELHGTVCLGDTPEDASVLQVVATAVPFSEYDTRLAIRRGGQAAETIEGPTLRVGYQPGTGFATRRLVWLDDMDLSDDSWVSLDEVAGRAELSILLPGDGLSAGMGGLATIGFSIGEDGAASFSGTLARVAEDSVSELVWTGERSAALPAEDGAAALVERTAAPMVFVEPKLPSRAAALSEPDPVRSMAGETLPVLLMLPVFVSTPLTVMPCDVSVPVFVNVPASLKL